ncbi:MAG: hypothetical protein JXB30_04690 [Anaerolineae bacterium]|nr:hypothetical protein [Anaerolineae bacterium]
MSQQSIFSETEKKAAERYLWWPIYLVREKRRLAGITEAVQAASAGGAEPADPNPEPPPVLPGESAEEYMDRVEKLREDTSESDVLSEND